MLRTLAPGAVHVHPESLTTAIQMAKTFGFGGLDFNIRDAANVGAEAAKTAFSDAGVAPAVFGLPVEWRKDEETFTRDLSELPALAAVARELGCTRTATWVLPGSNDRELEANEVFHVERFGPIAKVLGEEGISLGLEFIGPKTLRDQFTHPFHYTIAGMLGLAERIGPNVGLLLDAWHWYTSKGTLDDLRALQPDQIVYVHLNDAPEVVDIDAQVDNVRRLPGQTGVIDIAGFLDALRQIGYTGPIAVEPFYDALKELPNDEARLAAVRDSLDRIGV